MSQNIKREKPAVLVHERAVIAPPAEVDWILANPWLWVGAGFVCNLIAAASAQALAVQGEVARILLVFVGVLLTSIGVTIRLSSTQPAFLDKLATGPKQLLVMALGLLGAITFLTCTALVILSMAGVGYIPWHVGLLIVFWLLVGPLSLAAAKAGIFRGQGGIQVREERALILVVAALSFFTASWGLYVREEPLNWDMMRLFLNVSATVTLIGAFLALVSAWTRRLVISGVLVLHFIAIGTAVMGAPPASTSVIQLWWRITRPYLEFLYLNNAYHFYSPEPGPASYVWFRLIYEDPSHNQVGVWYKIPGVDSHGKALETVGLEHYRFLSMTENTTTTDPTPSFTTTDAQGKLAPAEFFKRRFEATPDAQKDPTVVGREKVVPPLTIPFHPQLAQAQQYTLPNPSTSRVIKSFARFVARMPHPQHPEWPIAMVKVYRVTHIIPPSLPFARGWLPQDPEYYHPYFMGDYSPEGELLNPNDPFLYWMMPILRENENDKESKIYNWALKQSGDENWVGVWSPLTRDWDWVKE